MRLTASLGSGDVRLRLGIIDLLPAHRPSAGAAEEAADPPIVVTRLAGIGLRQREIGARLRDLLRPAAVMQALDHGSLRGHLRLGLRELRLEAAGVEPRQHLPLAHEVAFLHQHLAIRWLSLKARSTCRRSTLP